MRVRPQRTGLDKNFPKSTKKGGTGLLPKSEQLLNATSRFEAWSDVPRTQRAFLSDLQAT